MLWKTVSGLVAVSLAVVAAADDSGAAAFAPAKIRLAVEPSDDSAVEGEAKATLAVEPFDPTVDTNITLAVEPVNANATDSLVATTLTLAPKTEAGPTCSVQAGVDYVGNDLKSVLGAVGDCCGKCQSTVGCNAYTWSDFNGGTCWLKTARGETKQVTGVTSGVVAVTGSQTEPNTDYIGNDVGSALGKDADACFDKCKAVTGCKAFTWSDFNGGTCWLKSARGQTKTVTGVYSAELPVDADADNSDWNVEKGVDYIGNDLTSVDGKTAADCQPKCAAYTGCRAFTWSDWNGGTCFLKSTRGATKSEKSVTSALIKTADVAPGQCNTEQGKDYIGKDIGNAAGADAADCCKQCSVKAGCEAYTWTKWEGGRCWFKSGVTGSKDNADAVSGKVAAGSSTTHVAFKLRSGEIPARSVNLGGWLVCEHWMSKTSPAWNNMPVSVAGSGEYGAMKHLGKDQGTKQFEEHRSSWITEADIKEIASAGLNMVRVPVGFWIVDDIPGVEPTPISSVYARGSLKYLDRLVNEWSVKYNVGIYLSLHAHQGSQNGYDHSAPQEYGKVEWSAWSNNVDNSVRFAKILAARYKDAPGFVGLQLLNEPAGSTNAEVRDQYYLRAYREIRANGNDCIIGISPMLYQQDQWVLRDFMRWPEYTNVWMEWHTYYKWGYENQNEDQIIAAVKTYRKDHFTNWPGNWVHIGEWSLGNGWNEEKFKNTNKLKEFAAAQMEQFTDAHAGWSFWSWHHDDEYLKEADGRNVVSGWNLRQLIRLGVITVPK